MFFISAIVQIISFGERFYLSPYENICSIALITINLYWYIAYSVCSFAPSLCKIVSDI